MSRLEYRIISKIVRELSLFLLSHGYRSYTINMKMEEENSYIKLRLPSITDELLESLQSKIERKRELEVETYGWELMGEMDDKNELEIVGLLIDDMIIRRNKKSVSIVLRRKVTHKRK